MRQMSDTSRPMGRSQAGRTSVPERRSTPRGPDGEPSRTRLVNLITGTYREMPGLRLTLPQAARLFGLRDDTCRAVLDDLVKRGRLQFSTSGVFAAAEDGVGAFGAVSGTVPLVRSGFAGLERRQSE